MHPGAAPAHRVAADGATWTLGISAPPDATPLTEAVLPMDHLFGGGGKYARLLQVYAQKEIPIIFVGELKTGTTAKELLYEVQRLGLPGRAAVKHIARVLDPSLADGFAFPTALQGQKRKRGGNGSNKPVAEIMGAPLNFATWRYPPSCFTGVPRKGQAVKLTDEGLHRASLHADLIDHVGRLADNLRTSRPSTWCRGSAAEVPDAWFGCRTRSCDVVAGHADRFSDVSHFDRRQRILQRPVQARRASEHLRSGPTSMCETGGAGELPSTESTCCTGPHDDVVGRADRFVGNFRTHARIDSRLTRLIGSTSQRASGVELQTGAPSTEGKWASSGTAPSRATPASGGGSAGSPFRVHPTQPVRPLCTPP